VAWSFEEIQEIAFEIDILGRYGMDINDPLVQPLPAVAAGGLQRPAARLHHARWLQEDRAGDGYQGWIWPRSWEMAEMLADDAV
jgi:hypothetical protein